MTLLAIAAALSVGLLIGTVVGRHGERARTAAPQTNLAELLGVDHSDTVVMQRGDGERHLPPVPAAVWPATVEIPVTRRTVTTEMPAVHR